MFKKTAIALGLLSLATSSYAQNSPGGPLVQQFVGYDNDGNTVTIPMGYKRYAACSRVSGVTQDNCGDDVIFQIPAEACGFGFSTSGARTTTGGFPVHGVTLVMPTTAMLTTLKLTQCRIVIGMGAPDSQWVRIGMNDPDGNFVSLYQQAWNFHFGDLALPYQPSAIIVIENNGLSWVVTGGSPNLMQKFGFGQMGANGQGRLDYVTTGPNANTLAECQFGGNGMIGSANAKAYMLSEIPANCVYLSSATSGMNYVTLANTASGSIDQITPGASNGAGGNYIVATQNSSFSNYSSGASVCLQNQYTYFHSDINGCWTTTAVNIGPTTSINLINKIYPTEAPIVTGPVSSLISYTITGDTSNGSPIIVNVSDTSHLVAGPFLVGTGIPANAKILSVDGPTQITLDSNATATGTGVSLTANDAISDTDPDPGVSFMFLSTLSFGGGRVTHPDTGIDIGPSLGRHVVGAYFGVSSAFVDTPCQRYVSSIYNKVIVPVGPCVYTANRATSSPAWAQPNAEIKGQFVFLGPPAKANSLGAAGGGVAWRLNFAVTNATPGNECDVGVSFNYNSGTPVVEQNIAKVITDTSSRTISGFKPYSSGAIANGMLGEGQNSITLVAKSPSSTACTFDKDYTFLSADVPQ